MHPDIKKIWGDVYVYDCPKCKTQLKSLWPKQLEANISEHNRKHQ